MAVSFHQNRENPETKQEPKKVYFSFIWSFISVGNTEARLRILL